MLFLEWLSEKIIPRENLKDLSSSSILTIPSKYLQIRISLISCNNLVYCFFLVYGGFLNIRKIFWPEEIKLLSKLFLVNENFLKFYKVFSLRNLSSSYIFCSFSLWLKDWRKKFLRKKFLIKKIIMGEFNFIFLVFWREKERTFKKISNRMLQK